MDETTQFVTVSLSQEKFFSWAFLVNWVLTCVASLTVVFYLSRILAYLITLLLEWTVWKSLGIKINIESLRLSLLSGQIVFKNLSVVDDDYIVSLLEGTLTWRYWLLKSRPSDYQLSLLQDQANPEDVNASQKTSELPCRFQLACKGVEVFCFNRTAAYHNIISMFSERERAQFENFMDENVLNSIFHNNQASSDQSGDKDTSTSSISTDMASQQSVHTKKTSHLFQKDFSLLSFLPVDLKFNKTSVVVGNKFTESLLVLTSANVEGIVNACKADSPLDLYKLQTNLKLTDFEIHIKSNVGYDEEALNRFTLDKNKLSQLWKTFRRIAQLTPLPFKKNQSKRIQNEEDEDAFIKRWRGLSIYKDRKSEDDSDEYEEIEYDFANHEYAKVSNVFKCSQIEIIYAYDSPGIVPQYTSTMEGNSNGYEVPPDYSMHIHLQESSIYYGSWAQRQIDGIRKMLAPTVLRTPEVAQNNKPGLPREHPYFKLSLLVEEKSTWRIPTREPSKDQEFLKQYMETNEDFRAFGWIDLLFDKGSEASVLYSFIADNDYYDNDLSIHFENVETRTSVNHDLFLKSKQFDINIKFDYPFQWDDPVNWKVDFYSNQLETFLLREHITLIADISTDFSTDSHTPYEQFRKLTYNFDWKIDGYSIYLNVNDRNIVNNPLDFNENCYMSVHGDVLDLEVAVSHETISASFIEVPYKINTPMFRLVFNAPPWNTLNEFMQYKEVGRAYDFTISGSYIYFSELNIDNVDTISIECDSTSTTLFCYGFVIRYLTNAKMNYFGDFFHFITAEEYTDIVRKRRTRSGSADQSISKDSISQTIGSYSTGEHFEDNVNQEVPKKRIDLKRNANETDVWLLFQVWKGALIFPEPLYNCDPSVAIHFGELSIDLRTCNYYMDTLMTLNDAKIKRYDMCTPNSIFNAIRNEFHSSEDIDHGSISDLTIHGHRMYGLPPAELTYYCQWSINIGSLEIKSNIEFIKTFLSAFSKIGFGHSNLENMLVFDVDIPDDMTSLTLDAEKVLIQIEDRPSNLLGNLDLDMVHFSSIDFQNQKYSKRLDVSIPGINFTIADTASGSDTILLDFSTHITFSDFVQRKDMATHLKTQREYISLNDSPYHRCSFLLPAAYQNSLLHQELYGSITPSFSLPCLPFPLLSETLDCVLTEFLDELIQSDDNLLAHIYSRSLELASSGFGTQKSFGVDVPNALAKLDKEERNSAQSYITDVGKVLLLLDPKLFFHLEQVLSNFYQSTITGIIDEIQMFIVQQLGKLLEEKTLVVNIKAFISQIDITWKTQAFETISFLLDNLDFEMSRSENENKDTKTINDLTLLGKFRSLKLNINQKATIPKAPTNAALSIIIEEWESWLSTVADQVSSWRSSSIDVTTDHRQLAWLIQFIQEQSTHLTAFMATLSHLQEEKVKLRKETILKLTAASEYYQISHDPYVITKPAFIMRLSDTHVRENRSWRIITRLRHILAYLPPDWEEYVSKSSELETGEVLRDAEDVFLAVFSNWRDWEVSDVARSYIYTRLFAGGGTKKSMSQALNIKLDSLYFTICNNNSYPDQNLILTKLRLIIEHRPEKHVPDDESTVDIKELEVTGTVGSAQCEINEKALEIKNILSQQNSEPAAPVKSSKKAPMPFKTNVDILLDRSDLRVKFGSTNMSYRMANSKLSVMLETPKDSARIFGSVIHFSSQTDMWVKHGKYLLGEAHFVDTSFSAASDNTSRNRAILLTTSSESINVISHASTQAMVQSLTEIRHNIKQELSSYVGLEKAGSRIQTQKTSLSFDVAVQVKIQKLDNSINILSPVLFKSNLANLNITWNNANRSTLAIAFGHADFYAISQSSKEQYLRLSCGNCTTSIHGLLGNTSTRAISLKTDSIKATFNDPKRMLYNFILDEPIISKSINLWREFMPVRTKSNEQVEVNLLQYEIDIDINYIGILLPVASTFFVIEFHEIFSGLEIDNNWSDTILNRIKGDISFGNILLLIKEPKLSSALSKLFDFSISASFIQHEESLEKSVEIESSHFRVCLSPESLVQLIVVVKRLIALQEYYEEHKPEDGLQQFFVEKTNKASYGSPLNIRSFHILSHKFCVGWLFHNSRSSHPGLIVGFDRLFSAYEDGMGKLTLVDCYFSIAKGETCDTFYTTVNEKDNYNRSYLPDMQIMYWFQKLKVDKELFIKFHGEALDVNFLSNIVEVVDAALQSIEHFQLSMQRKIKQLELARNVRNTKETILSTNSFPKFIPEVKKITCKFIYDGGKFQMFSVENGIVDNVSSLEFKTPRVLVDLQYKKMLSQLKSHWIRCLITVEPTYNILYAKCAPYIANFAESIQEMIKKYSFSDDVVETPKSPSPAFDYVKLLDSFDIAFKLSSGKQQLSLSCEPSAKVEANVEFGSFIFGMTTNDHHSLHPLSFSLAVNDICISIRHIFSKKPSASFSVGFVDITFMFTHPKMYGVALVSDIDVYFNVKQLQNLFLFLDIWKLSAIVGRRPGNPVKNSQEQAHDVAPHTTTQGASTLPISFTLIVTDISSTIQLGPALGLLKLHMRKSWFVSDKYSNNKHILHFFNEETHISSEGRLGGVIKVENIAWILEAAYCSATKLRPLVSLWINVYSISAKVSFDYHLFLISAIKKLQFHLHNERDPSGVLPDLLQTSLICEEINLSSTALIASNLFDIYKTLLRTRQDNRLSYIETLMESNTAETKEAVTYKDILESLYLLRTDLAVDLHKIRLQISPISLFDAEVIVVDILAISAKSQTHSGEKLKTEVNLQIKNTAIALATNKQELDEEASKILSVHEYMKYASGISGKNIFYIPQLTVSMTIFQTESSNTIEYLFSCKFNGSVAVRWNLGPVNFIKEMWATHVKSMAVRQPEIFQDANSLLEAKNKELLSEETNTKFKYIPLEEPIIEMPQIKDLEDATPPMEWFGVNRKRFPATTHQTVVVLLQKIVHTAQKEYARVTE